MSSAVTLHRRVHVLVRVAPLSPCMCATLTRRCASVCCQMRFLLLFSRQGKLRLQKWFTPMSEREKKKVIKDMTTMVLARQPRSCNFLHWKDLKIIYKRWAPHLCLTGLNDFLILIYSCLDLLCT